MSVFFLLLFFVLCFNLLGRMELLPPFLPSIVLFCLAVSAWCRLYGACAGLVVAAHGRRTEI